MKKIIGVIVVLICLLAITACVVDKKISLPEPSNLTRIEIKANHSEAVKKLTDKEEISKLINEIKDHSKFTNIESVNDQPVNVEHYIIIQFYHQNAEENPSIAYLYKKKGSHYIEQPYAGIWKLENEIVQTIVTNLLKGLKKISVIYQIDDKIEELIVRVQREVGSDILQQARGT